ncbi:transglycosylase domain-containing protein [Actinocatenispora comari]|uniref:Transglycosylase n=1 Tax=Actinocatenispora comari TaxID=2807577 RepID=A0A8J4AF41_9ACTN|nr:transglycosylase domain-containing protein [Actinocatenispora comari]GIL29490.1 transglycosylase [Actinocatenispora comari]
MANPDRDRHPLLNLAYLLLASVLAGVVVAAVAFPAVGATGFAAKTGSDTFEDLPTELTIPPSPENSYLYAADGKTVITSFYEQNRRDVGADEIPPVMRRAIVAAEDTRFYQHHGVDLHGVLRSLIANNSAGDVRQGASTLTMQYVRNVLFTAAKTPEQARAATAQTADRKLREMRYALALEKRMSKTEILRRYLNIAAFGHQAYGVYAASERYFSVPPSKLTLPQAALLAGLVKAPDAYDPTQADPKPATQRRNYVLDQMVALHYVDAKQAAAAKRSPLGLHPSEVPNGCVDVPAKHRDWGFFCDYFLTWWTAQQQFGDTRQARLDTLNRGGFKIVTTLDPKVQQIAQHEVLRQVSTHNPYAISMAVVQPRTGKVQAMATNRNYSLDTSHNGRSTRHNGQRGNYPNTTNPLISGGGDIYGYQAGSTFKMFTMLAALSAGKPLATSFKAPAKLKTRYPVGGGPASCGGYWCPSNANPSWMDGKRMMWDGFGRSVNTYFAWLEQQVGAEKAVAMAKKLGIRFRAPSDARLAAHPHEWGAFTLGVSAVTPLDLANAYATVAAEGVYCAPRSVLTVANRDGKAVSIPGADCHRVISADVARAATDAARCPVGQQSYYKRCNGGTAPNGFGAAIGRPFAGKTGTTDNTQTATFVGFTPQLAAAAIAADPDNPRNAVGDAYADKVDWAVGNTIRRSLAGHAVRQFGKPSKKIAGHLSSGRHKPGHQRRHHH